MLAVRDTGIGIAPEHIGSVFTMFSQVLPALERSQGGLGIGLALARGLVELHGGTIEAHSAGPGHGSQFVVRLPTVEAPIAGMLETPPPELLASPLRVLVVDDNRDAADSLAILLEIGGHAVGVAHDGPAALELAQSFLPDVVLLDIGMPGMNGYEVAMRLRAIPAHHGALLVALTGWGQDEDKRRAMAAGFDHHLTKPVDSAALGLVLAAGEARRS
jgi:CheY-like chemotaxis protein